MKKFALLTAVTQAVACDWDNVHASTDRTVVACAGGTCTAVPPTTQQEPADCGGGPNCATQEPAAPKVVCATSDCATEEPTDPAPTTVADGCSGPNC